jgi:hypothetical protein
VLVTLLFFASIAISGIWQVYFGSSSSSKKPQPVKNITTVRQKINPNKPGHLSKPHTGQEPASKKELIAKQVIASKIDQVVPKKDKIVPEYKRTLKSDSGSGTNPPKKRIPKIKKKERGTRSKVKYLVTYPSQALLNRQKGFSITRL